MNVKTIGVLVVLGAALMWALEPILAKLAYVSADFMQTQLIRVAIIALLAALYGIATKGKFKPTKKQIKAIVYVAVAGTLVADLIYFFALASIPSVNAVLLGHLQPVFIILMGFFILKEDKLNKFDYLGVLFMVLAGLFVTTRTVENLISFKIGTLGDLLVLFATVVWATTTIAMRKYLREMNAGVITFYRFFIATLAFGAYLVFTQGIVFPNIFQLMLGAVGAFGTILYYEGLKRIKAAQVSALELAAPFFAAILGFFVLEEVVFPMQIIGLLLLVAGVYFLSKKEA
ncbi:MAG: DMT family transporter [Candidatus Diapherotrites archaeon]